jgi:ABC-type sugar transport system ATPase subunit
MGSGLSVRGLGFARRGIRVLDGVSFELAPGRLLAVVGLSGAGKSTLLSLIAGFERPSEGEVSFAGRSFAGLSPADRSIGMAFDDAALHEHLTVRANLDSAALPRAEPAERRHARVRALADSLGLAALLDRMPATLSAGERRRTAVGRAFIRGGELVLLDEPFANLDRGNRFAIRQAVRELQRSTGATTIVVTHDPTDALAIADDFLVLIDGRQRAFGPAADVAARPVDLEVAQLVDDLGMHAIELDARGESPDCALRPGFRDEALQRAGGAAVTLGIRPWHIRPQQALTTPPSDAAARAVVMQARVVAHEPAGVFTDVIALRSAGRALRARLSAAEAQDLPIGSTARLTVDERDIHLFAGPWPGRRVN